MDGGGGGGRRQDFSFGSWALPFPARLVGLAGIDGPHNFSLGMWKRINVVRSQCRRSHHRREAAG
uniref:Uncharacterized protein n=1 Tax=Leersia perrieri TaxID=77586 RepID=A0A0D9Y1B0_9ORYZ